MEDRSETSLGVSAESFYDKERGRRDAPTRVARRLADISIPSVFPPENWQSGDAIAIPNQSVNAFAINTLASKLMLGALPPGLPMAKYTPVETALADDIKADPQLWSQLQYALSRLEEIHRERLESTGSRWAYAQTMRLKLVTGNALILWTDIDNPVVYNMHHYVVKRRSNGEVWAKVLEELVPMELADEDVKSVAMQSRSEKGQGAPNFEDDIRVFHCEKLLGAGEDKEWVYWQEVEGGHKVPDSEAYSPYAVPTMYASGMIPEYGSDWYLPYCGDYEGDLQAVETFQASIQDMAAAAGWNIILVDPNGQTDRRDVEEADNLSVLAGRPQDVSTLKSQKGGDHAIVAQEAEQAGRRLGRAFLTTASIQRSGERVTAEEWRELVEELETAMGGLYSQISQTTQRWFVLRFIHLHEMENDKLFKLPDHLVRAGVVTGLDSIGQTSEGRRLREALLEAKEAFGDAIGEYLDISDGLRRIFANKSIKSEGLVKDPKQVEAGRQAQQQQHTMNTLLEKGTAPVAKEGAGMLGEMFRAAQGEENVQQ